MIPFPLLPPLPMLNDAVFSVGQETKEVQIQGLTVRYDGAKIDLATNILVFTGSITAQYDETVIECSQLELRLDEQTGRAAGGVRLTDPAILLECDSLEFDWKNHTGEAFEVTVEAGGMTIRAQSLEIRTESWFLRKARATLSRRDKPEYELLADRVTIYPGRYGVAESVGLLLFGAKLGWLPSMRFELDPRVTGWRMPSFADRRGVGFGLSWDTSLMLSEKFSAYGFWNTFPSVFPTSGLQLTLSNVNPNSVYRKLVPRSDLLERISSSWFDNVRVKSPEREYQNLRDPRLSFTVGTLWNQQTDARAVEIDSVSNQFELVLETVGSRAGFGLSASARLERIRADSSSNWLDRAELLTTVQTPPVNLGDSLRLVARIDGFGTVSANGGYGWVRGLVGVIYNPSPSLTLGVAYANTGSWGTPDFPFDPLVFPTSLHVRADFVSGPYTLRYLVRYDPTSQTVFDTEYEIALAAESFEPYILFREFPSDFRMGIRFRLGPLRDRLSRRKTERDVRVIN